MVARIPYWSIIIPTLLPKMHRREYCQYLLLTHINHTLTYFAEHRQLWSHDTIRDFLKDDDVTPSDLWKGVKGAIVHSSLGYILFDDTVIDKNYSKKIALVRRQWSGNTKSIIRGIGVVSCIYVHPETNQFWVIDYRLYDPEGDGKTKIDHVEEMLAHTTAHKRLPFTTVLMDSWYAATALFKQIEKAGKIYYCPVKSDRLADDTDGAEDHKGVAKLTWSAQERQHGKTVHLKTMPKGHRVKLFRLVLSSERTDYIVTNDRTQDSIDAVKEIVGIRWKIEQFFRETKQLTGIERCQCRLARLQRNHIGSALLVWNCLKQNAYATGKTIYELKHSLLDDYMKQQLAQPSILFS
jgi:Transposase DDE domain